MAKVNEVKVTPEEEEGLHIEIKLTVTLGDKKFISIANLVKERIAVSLRYFTGLDVKTVDVIIAEVKI